MSVAETTKQDRERAFHNEAFATATRKSAGNFYAIVRDSRRALESHLLPGCAGLVTLEYGCGAGTYSFRLAELGAQVTGIDISDVAIQQAAAEAKHEGLSDQYRRMDAEALEFADNTFDLVCGVAILHHLDLDKALAGLVRVLKPGGRAVFMEPLAHNPAINLYRRLTPRLRTPDEHPLRMRDLDLPRKYFGRVHTEFYNLSTLLAVPFRHTTMLNPLLDLFNGADRMLFTLCPPARRFAWQVVIVLEQPRKDGR